MPPNDEHELWAGQGNPYPKTGSPPNTVLNQYYPELVRAGGQVDPTEALVSLIDKVKELEARLNGLNPGSAPSSN